MQLLEYPPLTFSRSSRLLVETRGYVSIVSALSGHDVRIQFFWMVYNRAS